MKNIMIIALITLGGQIMSSQSWQWGKRGGGDSTASSIENNEEVRSIFTDASGNVIILSSMNGTNCDVEGHVGPSYGSEDMVIASFTCDGTYRWSTVIGGPSLDYSNKMQIDANGDVYIIGRASYGVETQTVFHFDDDTFIPYATTNRKTFFLAKYDGDNGELIWYKMPQPDGLTPIDYGQTRVEELIVEPDGTSHMFCRLTPGLYANGEFNNTVAGTNTFVLQYDISGNYISAIPLDMYALNSFGARQYFSIKKSSFNNNFYVAGYSPNPGIYSFGGQLATGYIYLAAYSQSGQFLWMKTDIPDDTGSRRINDFFIDTNGDLYLAAKGSGGDSFAGYTISTTLNSLPVLYKLDADGNLIWGSNATYAGGSTLSPNGISVTGQNVMLTMGFNGFTWDDINVPLVINGGFDAGIARFDKMTGEGLDYTTLTSPFGSVEVGSYLTSDIHGNFYIGGSFNSSMIVNGTTLQNNGSATDFFIAKYGSADCTLAVENFKDVDNLELAPNPVHGLLNINCTENMEYAVYNILGIEVLNGHISPEQNTVDAAPLSSGQYLIKLADDGGNIKTLKFLKD